MAQGVGVQGNLERNVYCLLGLPFDALDMAGAVQRVRDAAAQRRRCFISTPNLNFLINSQNDAPFRDSVIMSDLSIADGMPLVWMARLLRLPLPERVPGSGLFDQLRKRGATTVSVYFFGGPDGVAEAAARRLNAEASGMVCVGFESPGHGSLDELSSDDRIARINASGADLLVVSLGAKKGQAWIERNRASIVVPAISHLGAVVNFVAGTVRRAPTWMQNVGLEWLWRIKEEPSLWRRYLGDGFNLLRLLFARILPFAWLVRWHKPQRAAFDSAELQLIEKGNEALIRLRGAWAEENLPRLRACLMAVTAAGRNVRIDLSGVSYVDSSFLGLLLLLYGVQKQAARHLSCEAASARVGRIFAYACSGFLLRSAARGEAGELDLEETEEAIGG